MRSATKRGIGKDPAYLKWLHTLACICCSLGELRPRDPIGFWKWTGWDRIEAAHVGVRGMSQKCPDREAIPLCSTHHRLGRDAAHRLGKKFWEHHGIDPKRLIADLNQRYETERI